MRLTSMLLLMVGTWGCSALPACCARADTPAPGDVVPAALHPHPRLIASDDDLARVKKLIADDPMVRDWSAQLIAAADKLLSAPSPQYDAARGIEVARELLQRITTLGVVYRLTGDKRYAERACGDMLAAASFPDWDKPSFLATAETTAAVAIGYDWLLDTFAPADRQTLRRAIADKGLRRGVEAYHTPLSWVEARHNWNLVCNGGMLLGALAVMDEEPDLARDIVTLSRASIVNGLAGFARDGGWEEGPTYWKYATRYLAFYISAMQSSYGTTFGYERYPGLARTGEFRIHTTGPTSLAFNFADAAAVAGASPQMLAMGAWYKRPEFITWELHRSEYSPGVFDLLWYQPLPDAPPSPLAPDAFFRGPELAAFRSRFNDREATYVSFKGGSNKAHHGHLDLGTFVLDAAGQRWAMDLGPDSYDLPGYSTDKRWTYYRCSTPGHNTLTFDDSNQPTHALAPLVAFHSADNRAHAVVDLTTAYKGHAERILRGVALLDRRDVLVQDDIDVASPQHIAWAMHTRASIELQGRTAILTQNGAKLTATLLSPAGATFESASANPPPPQAQQPDVRKLLVRVAADAPLRIAVLFTPGDDKPNPPAVSPLRSWQSDEILAAPTAEVKSKPKKARKP